MSLAKTTETRHNPAVPSADAVLNLKRFTTVPTTGLVKGDTMLLFHGSTPKLGVCTSTAAQTVKLIRLRTKTFGRLTA